MDVEFDPDLPLEEVQMEIEELERQQEIDEEVDPDYQYNDDWD